MGATITIRKVNKLDNGQYQAKLLAAMDEYMHALALYVIDKIEEPKNGITYNIKGTVNQPYVASKPGEYPAVKFGKLVGTLDVDVRVSETGKTIAGTLIAPVEYAEILNDPNFEHSRPFMKRAVLETKSLWQSIFKKHLEA